MSTNQAIINVGTQPKPIWRNAEGEIATAPKKDIWGNVASIFDSISTGVSSVFGSLTTRNQLQMQQNDLAYQQQQNAGKTVTWVIGGVAVLVVIVLLMRK